MINSKLKILLYIIPLFFCSILTEANESEGILNKLLAPGPLIIGHQKLEKKDCLKCHDAGQGIPDQLCLECHKEIKKFKDSKSGYHGRLTQQCIDCHSDHKGRNHDTTKLDTQKFDHTLTGYHLQGQHAELKCTECHKEKRTQMLTRKNDPHYLGAAKTCVSCHKKDDPHQYKDRFAKMDCNVCHSFESWKKDILFDHNRDTKFKLIESHAKLKCNDCHLSGLAKGEMAPKNILSKKGGAGHKTLIYQWPELSTKECLTCHTDNFHFFNHNTSVNLKEFNRCSQCHRETKWNQDVKFDHGLQTQFKLEGEHSKLRCQECHLPLDFVKNNGKLNFKRQGDTLIEIKKITYHWNQLSENTCNTCHKSPHKNEFSPELLKAKCTQCHTPESWTTMKDTSGFDHQKTAFALTGRHKEIRCSDCHGPSGKQIFKFKTKDQNFCIDCHQNIHLNQWSAKMNSNQCVDCHTTNNFTERKTFDHQKTNYPLTGSHLKINCSECHTAQTPIDKIKTPNVNKKIHPEGKEIHWSKFQFPDLLKKDCLTCHTDYHKGQLNSKCLNCHSDEKWKPVLFDHNRESRFPLFEKHARLKCQQCHLPVGQEKVIFKKESKPLIRYKPLGQLCYDCHKDVHKGAYGQQCQECHSERGWNVTKNFHKNFTLSGVHFSMECSECHKDGKKLAGLSQQCISCHLKDDVHNGTLSNCKECHQQQFWDISAFKHSMTRFPLRGAHRTIECFDCHKNGTYKGLNDNCFTCHEEDARSATSFDHSKPPGYYQSDCSRCHMNQFSFSGAKSQ